MASAVDGFTGGASGSAGQPLNHLCLSMSADGYYTLMARLLEQGIEPRSAGPTAFGAQGLARSSSYFSDPDGNVIEIRYYDED